MNNPAYRLVPIAIGLVATRVAVKAVDVTWSRISENDAPNPTDRDASWKLILIAAGLEGFVMGLARAVAARSSAHAQEHLTGKWPGDKHVND